MPAGVARAGCAGSIKVVAGPHRPKSKSTCHAHMSGYWEQCNVGHGMRPSWKFACTRLQDKPMLVLGRSHLGKQMLCKGQNEIFLLMFSHGRWGIVGGAISFKGEPLRAEELLEAVFVEDAECTVIMRFASSKESMERKSPPVMGILHPAAHVNADGCAFRWIFDAEQRRSLGRRLQAQIMERRTRIEASIGQQMMSTYLQLDMHSQEMSPSLDFVPVFHAMTPQRDIKLHGRPRFSRDKTSRGFRASSLKADQEVTCMGALIAVLSTVHSCSEQWRVDGTVQLLFAQTHASAMLERTRSTARSRVGQLRRWLPFAKALVQASDDFKEEVDEQILDRRLEQRAVWAKRRAPLVCELVRDWIEKGSSAEDIFVAKREEWSTEGLTAAKWVEKCFIHIKRAQAAPVANNKPVPLDRVTGGPALLLALETFMHSFRESQTNIMTAVQEAQPEQVEKVGGLFDAIAQNVGAQMRNSKGTVEMARKIRTMLDRMRSACLDNQRLAVELQVAVGDYTDDAGAIASFVQAASREFEGIMHRDIAMVNDESTMLLMPYTTMKS